VKTGKRAERRPPATHRAYRERCWWRQGKGRALHHLPRLSRHRNRRNRPRHRLSHSGQTAGPAARRATQRHEIPSVYLDYLDSRGFTRAHPTRGDTHPTPFRSPVSTLRFPKIYLDRLGLIGLDRAGSTPRRQPGKSSKITLIGLIGLDRVGSTPRRQPGKSSKIPQNHLDRFDPPSDFRIPCPGPSKLHLFSSFRSPQQKPRNCLDSPGPIPIATRSFPILIPTFYFPSPFFDI